MNPMNSEGTLNEVVSRMRRIETRLTAYMASQGVEFHTQPRWVMSATGVGHIELATLTVSLAVCRAVVPKDYSYSDIDVLLDGRLVAVLYLDDVQP